VGFSARSPFSGLQGITLGILKGLSLPAQLIGIANKTPAGVDPILSRDSIAWLLLAGLMVYGLSVLRRRRRDQKSKSRAGLLNRDQVRAIQLFRTVLRKVRRAVPEYEGKTADEIARMLAQTDAEKAKTVQDLILAYNEARFGGRPMTRARYLDLRKAARTLTA
ncbi:MAG: DUF4129 domain-containing protein, partial [FCB group bacterium]|nr:DUF4129 domain-containing protein [FCB group bacterium]